ncbi:MAG: TonB-dependent receptor, partial [Bacteroidia bacterium]
TILDRTEILFGPSSTIYGSDALGGVVHFYTKKPLFASEGENLNIKVNAATRYGSADNEVMGHVDFNIGCKKLASLTSFTYSMFDDLKGGTNQNPFYTGSYGERPYYQTRIEGKDSLMKNADRYLQVESGYSQYDILEKLAFKQNEHVTHGLNIQYSNSTDVPRYDRLTDPAGTGLRYAEWYYGPQMRMLTAYDLNINNTTSFFQNIHAGVNFQNIEESRHNRSFGSKNLSHRIEKVNVMGANLDLQRISGKHNIRLGLDAQYNTLKSTANRENIETGEETPLDTRYPDGDNTMMSTAIYFSHTMQINNELTLTDGLRVGYISLHSTLVDTALLFHLPYTTTDQSYPVASGSIGLISSPSDDVKLSALISTGYRAPNLDDLSKIFESAPGDVIVPNEDLKPEKTVNTEIGIAKIFNEKAIWENTVYYTHIYDAIVTDVYKYNGQDSILYDGTLSQVYANQNKRRAYIYGFSSTIKSQCTENLLLSFTMNYTYGRIKTDTSDAPLDHISPFMMRLQLNYTKNKFSSDFFVNYNGWKKLKDYNLGGEDNEQYATPDGMPAWFTLNLRVGYQVIKQVKIQAGVDNILDTQYRTFSSGINAPGRNVFVALRASF